MGDAEDGAPRFVGEAFDLPAVREHDLLDDRQAQTGALLLGREVGLEDLGAAVRGNARAVVADLEHGFGGIALFGDDLDFAAAIHGLDGVEQQIEERLPEQLLVGLDAELLALDLQADLLLLQVVVQGADDFVDHRAEGEPGAADFARAGVVDELVQLRGHLVGLVNDLARLPLNLRRGAGLLGDHLGQAADDVERVAGFVGQAGGGEVHLLEMRVHFAGAHQADLQLGGLGQVSPGQAGAEDGNRRQQHDDRPQPQITGGRRVQSLGGHGEDQAVQRSLGDQGLEFLLVHAPQPEGTPGPARPAPAGGRPAHREGALEAGELGGAAGGSSSGGGGGGPRRGNSRSGLADPVGELAQAAAGSTCW